MGARGCVLLRALPFFGRGGAVTGASNRLSPRAAAWRWGGGGIALLALCVSLASLAREFTYGSDMGTYQTLVTGRPVGSSFDFYAESSALSDEILIGTRDISTAGDIMVLFIQQPPNESATASRMCVDKLIFE